MGLRFPAESRGLVDTTDVVFLISGSVPANLGAGITSNQIYITRYFDIQRLLEGVFCGAVSKRSDFRAAGY